jgi:hypothetical protein
MYSKFWYSFRGGISCLLNQVKVAALPWPEFRSEQLWHWFKPKGKEMAVDCRCHHGIWTRLRKINPLFLNYLPEQPWYISKSMQPVLLF